MSQATGVCGLPIAQLPGQPRWRWWTRQLYWLTVALLALPLHAELTAYGLMQKVGRSTGVVATLDEKSALVSMGGGVVVAPGVAGTHRHLIAVAGMLREVIINSRTLSATLLGCDDPHDICLLQVPGLDSEAVAIANPKDAQRGDTIFLVSATEGTDPGQPAKHIKPAGNLGVSQGVISALRSSGDATLIDNELTATGGATGGGLFDGNGRLLGIQVLEQGKEGIHEYAVAAHWIGPLLDRLIAEAPPDSPVLVVSPGARWAFASSDGGGLKLTLAGRQFSLTPNSAIGLGLALLALLILLIRWQPRSHHTHGPRAVMNHDPLPAAMTQAEAELQSGQVDGALWATVQQAVPDDPEKARQLYLARRARVLINTRASQRISQLNQ